MKSTDASSELKELYPFLYEKKANKNSTDEVLLEAIQQKHNYSTQVAAKFFSENSLAVLEVAHAIAVVYSRGGRLFTMGNGGSSCDAAHIAVEFLHPVTAGRPALSAIHLGAEHAMVSALGNDLGFSHVYSRQIIANANEKDGLIGISTSGNSKNLLTAFKKAKEMGLITIAFSGGEGGEMSSSEYIDYCLVVQADSIHRIQECHVLIYHILWDIAHSILSDERKSIKPEEMSSK